MSVLLIPFTAIFGNSSVAPVHGNAIPTDDTVVRISSPIPFATGSHAHTIDDDTDRSYITIASSSRRERRRKANLARGIVSST